MHKLSRLLYLIIFKTTKNCKYQNLFYMKIKTSNSSNHYYRKLLFASGDIYQYTVLYSFIFRRNPPVLTFDQTSLSFLYISSPSLVIRCTRYVKRFPTCPSIRLYLFIFSPLLPSELFNSIPDLYRLLELRLATVRILYSL